MYRLDAIVCNNKQQRWNKDKCNCECKKLIDKGVCDKEYTWNPSNCEYECDKSCDVGEYLDYENCKRKKRLINKLVDESTGTIEKAKLANIIFAENKNSCKCISCTVYIVLLLMFFTINVGGIVTYYVYSQFNTKKETTI